LPVSWEAARGNGLVGTALPWEVMPNLVLAPYRSHRGASHYANACTVQTPSTGTSMAVASHSGGYGQRRGGMRLSCSRSTPAEADR